MPTEPSYAPLDPNLAMPRIGWVRGLLSLAALGLLALATAELGARVDDWFFQDIPVLANPSYDNLFTIDANGQRHGKPGARWKRVVLNNFGLRGPTMTQLPAAQCERWLFIGASETFGEPSSADGNYPAKLRNMMDPTRCVEIVNSAFPGMNLNAIVDYYSNYLAQFHPTHVFVYAPVHFYLQDDKPAAPARANAPAAAPAASSPLALLQRLRILERLKDTAEMPRFVQQRRVRGWIDAELALHAADWVYQTVPAERLSKLNEDLNHALDVIEKSGARPVLMTHAMRATDPPRAEDIPDLWNMRVYLPRAPEPVIAGFNAQADQSIRAIAARRGVTLIDVAAKLSGRRERFIDLVHFTPEGAGEVATLIHDTMAKQLADTDKNHAVQ